MALVSKSIPNFINGISQQPPSLRLASQGEAQENGYSDIVEGLKKRPPTKFKRKLNTGSPASSTYLTATELATAHIHTYKRSNTEQFTVILVPATPKLYVYDIEGRLRYESGVASWDVAGSQIATNSDTATLSAYFGTSLNNQQVTATSVADYTFYVNKEKAVAKSSEIFPNARPNEALVYLKQANYSRRYEVTIQPKSTPTTAFSALGHVETTANSTTESALRTDAIIKNIREGIGNTADSGEVHRFPARTSFAIGSAVNEYEVATAVGVNYATDPANIQVRVGGTLIPNSDFSINTSVSPPVLTVDNSYSDFSFSDLTYQMPEVGVFVTDFVDGGTSFVVAPNTEASFFIISNTSADFDINVSDDSGGTDLRAFKGTARSFTDLPNQCLDGFHLGVIGDNQKKEDNFYVKFSGDFGQGVWKETVQAGIQNKFDLSTMPHTLIQNANESFSFTTGAWDERKAGDDDTNPFPSFVGGKINDVFFHRNRLGFLSDENVIFSEANGYFNFFRTTVRSLLDSAPIDVAVSQNEVSILKAAIPFQEQLLLFSEINQFTLSADQLLTPAEVSIDTSTNFECDLTTTPVGAGNSVFFAVQNGTFSGMREYYTTGDTEVKDANLITAHIPNYLAGSVKQMIASTNENLLLVRTTTDVKELYVYKWYENETERLQSSWSKWKFDANIAHVAFNNEEIFIVFEDGRFENMTLSLDPELLNIYPMHLDHQQKFTSGAPSMGYTDSNLVYYNSKGEPVTSSTVGTSTTPVYGGIPYTFKYQLSEQVFKPEQGDASDIARFQLRTISFTYNDTGTFTVTQTNGRRDPTSAVFTGRLLGDLDNVLDQSAVDTSGNFKVGVQSQAKEAAIEITNDSPLPSVFQKAEWEGFVVLRSQRI